MDPWRYSTEGISVALRVTPRGGRDDIDGVETLANGRTVVKVRVRAIAEGGDAFSIDDPGCHIDPIIGSPKQACAALARAFPDRHRRRPA